MLRAGVRRGSRAAGARWPHIAIYWDPSICVEAGVELHGAFVTQGSIVLSATPAGRIASATHWGPYQDLGTAHQSIRRWSKSTSERLAGPNWEIYGHWQPTWNAKPAEIRTDIYYLLGSS
jgi:effector-binding domain-containing protein